MGRPLNNYDDFFHVRFTIFRHIVYRITAVHQRHETWNGRKDYMAWVYRPRWLFRRLGMDMWRDSFYACSDGNMLPHCGLPRWMQRDIRRALQ